MKAEIVRDGGTYRPRGKKTLETWIRERLTDPDKVQQCTAFVLDHMIGQTAQPLHSKRLGSQPVDPHDLAEFFRDVAETHAQDLPGVQTFRMCAFYGDSGFPEAQFPFTVAGKTEFDGLMTEGPDGKGLVAQSMRHSEAIVQLAFRQTQAIFETSERTIRALSDQNSQLMLENREALEVVKSLLLAQADNAHAHRMAELQFQRSSAERQKWLAFGPALVNTILGREVFPQSTADTALIETIADQLTTEQIEQLSGSIPPTLWGPLAARMNKYLESKSVSRPTNLLKCDPEADAAGE